jgi:hypothetical protein
MSGNRLFRGELPGERKSLINLVMTGYIVAISCMGYMAFYLFIQLGQIEKIIGTMNLDAMNAQELGVLKTRVAGSLSRIGTEMLWITAIGGAVCVIAMGYTYNMIIRPLNRMIVYTETRGKNPLPEFKSNHELKQLATAIVDWKAGGETRQDGV